MIGTRFGIPLLAGVLAMASLLVTDAARAETENSRQASFEVVTVTRGLEHPWALAFLPDGRKLVTERPGRLRLVSADGTLDPTPISGLPPIADRGQGGLLDVALHPRFEETGWVYLSLAAPVDGGLTTRVVRGRLEARDDGAAHALVDLEEIFTAVPASRGGRHFGSRLAFDRAGRLYVTVGDRGRRQLSQRLDSHVGTVVRLEDDGSVPDDNPYVGSGLVRSDRVDVLPRPEIWTWGHRNPQGLTIHPETGFVWLAEHGPRGGDEINLLVKKVNYGWPVITHGREYSGAYIAPTNADGYAQPIHVYDRSISPSGMMFYTGEAFPAWRGDLFLGSLSRTHLNRLEFEGGRVVAEERLLANLGERIRDVRQGSDGLIYLLTDSSRGRILRLEPR